MVRLVRVRARERRAKMERFGDVAEQSWDEWPACGEVTHHEPCVAVLGLGVEGDDLCADLKKGHRIEVAAGDFSAEGVDAQPTALGV